MKKAIFLFEKTILFLKIAVNHLVLKHCSFSAKQPFVYLPSSQQYHNNLI